MIDREQYADQICSRTHCNKNSSGLCVRKIENELSFMAEVQGLVSTKLDILDVEIGRYIQSIEHDQ